MLGEVGVLGRWVSWVLPNAYSAAWTNLWPRDTGTVRDTEGLFGGRTEGPGCRLTTREPCAGDKASRGRTLAHLALHCSGVTRGR